MLINQEETPVKKEFRRAKRKARRRDEADKKKQLSLVLRAGFSEPSEEEARRKALKKGDEKLRQLNEQTPGAEVSDEILKEFKKEETQAKSVAKMAVGIYLNDLFKTSAAAASEEQGRNLASNKKTYESKMAKILNIPTHFETVKHLCEDTACLDLLVEKVNRVPKMTERGIIRQSAMFTSTIDSINRVRDARIVSECRKSLEEGNDETQFVSALNKRLGVLATGYTRIVYGDHGPYVEFEEHHLDMSKWPKIKEKSKWAFYDERRTEDGKILLYV